MSGVRTIYEPKGAAAEYAPLALNLAYGCQFGCRYCYARPMALANGLIERIDQTIVRHGVLPALEAAARAINRRAYGDAGRGLFDPPEARILTKPVLLSFMSDPYQPAPGLAELRRAALETLTRHGLTVKLLSKAGLAMTVDHDLLAAEPGRHWAGATITTLDDELAALLEPGAAPPAQRAQALALAKERGLNAWLSIEPGLIGAHALAVIELGARIGVDHMAVGGLSGAVSIPGRFRAGRPVTLAEITGRLADLGYRRIGLGLAETGGMPPAGQKTYYIKHALAMASGDGAF